MCGSAAARLLHGIAVSNPARDVDIYRLRGLYTLRRADHSSRGVLPGVMCLNVMLKPRQGGGPGPLGAVKPWGKINK